VYKAHIDFETRSLADLPKVGEHVYARHASTTVLMLSYECEGMADVDILDFFAIPGYPQFCLRPPMPAPLREAVERGDRFTAHNARFEQAIWYWICHLKWGWPMPAAWSCTAARARYMGIRASLEGAASDLEVPHQKDEFGKWFIDNFCKPRKYKGPKRDGIIKEMWYEPSERPEEWGKGKQYCISDTRAEKDIDALLPELPPFEQAIWDLDFRVNTRGLPIDVSSVRRAKMFSDHYTQLNVARFNAITDLNPTQRDKVLAYINQREEISDLGDLRSKTLKRIIQAELPQDLQDVINIRIETSKASVKKLEAMERCTDSDGRARGLFLFYGAHTGRWTAKRVQPQNFTRPDAPILKGMFEYLQGEFWNTGMVGHNGGPPLDEMPQQPAWVFEAGLRFARPLSALAKSMKGFIAAPPGTRLVTSDYAQIEARVLAWLARCTWLLNAFRAGDDVYTRFAAEHMYGRRYEDCIVIKNGKHKVIPLFEDERQRAKSAELACGFGLGPPKFVEYCDNIDLIISLEEAKTIVKAYRRAHPEIADYERGLWARVERAAITAATNENERVQLRDTGIVFSIHRIDSERYWLICTLPSGRHIAYYRPKVRLGMKFGRTAEILSFRTEWVGKSFREDTYGGKLVENIVQGTARDVCAQGALNAENAGYPVHGYVHDELITLPSEGFGSHRELSRLMCDLPEWITDCPVEAEGAEMVRYGNK
jgi:DNA polymerase